MRFQTPFQLLRGMLFALALSALLAGGPALPVAKAAQEANAPAPADPAATPGPAVKPEPASPGVTPGPAAKPESAPLPAAPGPAAKPEPAPSAAASSKPDSGSRPAAASKPDAPEKDESLAGIWSSRAGDLALLAKEAATLRGNAEAIAAPLSANLQGARAQAARLSSLFQASRGHPMEQLILVRQMLDLQEKLRNDIKPLEDIAATIGQRLDDIAELQKDLEDFSKESAGTASDAELAELRKLGRTMADTKSKLTGASGRLEKLLAPARAASKQLDQTITNTEGSLAAIWHNYYLTPSSYGLDAYTSAPALLAEWKSSLGTRLRFAYPQSAAEWQESVKSFVITSVVMALLGFAALRGARVLPDHWRRACLDICKGAWIGVGGGFSLLVASTNPSGGFYVALAFLGVLAVIAGVAALSWRLRTAVNATLSGSPSPLNRLLPAAFAGVFMLFSDLAPRILNLAWGAVMLAFLGWVYYRNRKHSHAFSPLLERLSYGGAFWVGLASLLTALFGYARLGILLFMFLFALVNVCTLGGALTALFQNLSDTLFDKRKFPLRNTIAEALSIPAAWLFSLLCTVPWLWAVPGARYLLRSALEANYTLGEASFDFSRLLLIVVLFFLTRSLVSLVSTSLSHLPDHMPHIERGVIPPLRTMVTYLSWAVFGLIVLGSLGVNFTSLAVVAGGLSVGIGFGVQNLFNNLVSGLILIFGRTILVGDYVDVANVSGTVRAINIRSTTIETPDRALVYVPNSFIMANQFSNWTRLNRMVRRGIGIRVAYGSDTNLVSRLLLEVAGKQEHVRKTPPPAVFFTDFDTLTLNFTLNVFIDDIDNSASTLSDIRFDVEKAFSEHGIETPARA